MKYNSEAYQEGLKSGLYDTNPYEKCLDEFDEYERGGTRKLKRLSSAEFNSFLTSGAADTDEQFSNDKIEGYERISNKYRKKRERS